MECAEYRDRFCKEILRICREYRCDECDKLTYTILTLHTSPSECQRDAEYFKHQTLSDITMLNVWRNAYTTNATLATTIQRYYSRARFMNVHAMVPEYDVLLVQLQKSIRALFGQVHSHLHTQLTNVMFFQRSITVFEMHTIAKL